MWSFEPHECLLAACSAKGVPSFLNHFKALFIGPASGIEPATSRCLVTSLLTELILPQKERKVYQSVNVYYVTFCGYLFRLLKVLQSCTCMFCGV